MSAVNWLAVGGQVAVTILGAAGVTELIKAVASRRTRKIDNVDRLSDIAIEQVEAIKKDAREARDEARSARQEAAGARREMHEIRQSAEEISRYLYQVLSWIHDPQMTIERLRAVVPPPGTNGGTPSGAPPLGRRVQPPPTLW